LPRGGRPPPALAAQPDRAGGPGLGRRRRDGAEGRPRGSRSHGRGRQRRDQGRAGGRRGRRRAGEGHPRRGPGRGGAVALRRPVGTALITRLILVVPAVTAVLAYTTLARTGPQLTLIIWLAAVAMLLGLLSGPFLVALQATERMQFTAYSDILSKAVVAGLSV